MRKSRLIMDTHLAPPRDAHASDFVGEYTVAVFSYSGTVVDIRNAEFSFRVARCVPIKNNYHYQC